MARSQFITAGTVVALYFSTFSGATNGTVNTLVPVSDEEPSTMLYERAKAAYDNEEYETGIALCDEIIVYYPGSETFDEAEKLKTDCYCELSLEKIRRLVGLGRLYEASVLLVELSAIAPYDVRSNYAIGWVYLETSVTIAGEASSPEVGEAVSAAYLELAKYRFERCIEIDENASYGYKGMALYYYSTDDLDKALEEIDKAVENAPDDTEKISTRGLRATILAQKGDFDASKAEIDKLAEDFPDRGEVYLPLAEYYYRKDITDPEKSVEALNTGLEKETEEEATKGRMLSLKANLMAQTGDFDGAMEALKAALEIDPFNQDYLETFTLLYAHEEILKE
jgi:tetratricopeptide (TPR) repeat protein